MRVAVSHNMSVIGGSAMLSVVLQANLWFSILVFVIAAWAAYAQKLAATNISGVDRVWYAALLSFWTVAEGPRLALGFNGNRTQSGALLFAFLALTAFGHIILMLAFVFIIPKRNSLDVALGTVELTMASLELIFGLNLMSSLVTSNTVDFYVGLKRADEDDAAALGVDESGADTPLASR